MNKTDARAWLARFGDLPDDLRPACKYGHVECSTTPRGECLDEVIIAAVNPPDDGRLLVTYAQYRELILA